MPDYITILFSAGFLLIIIFLLRLFPFIKFIHYTKKDGKSEFFLYLILSLFFVLFDWGFVSSAAAGFLIGACIVFVTSLFFKPFVVCRVVSLELVLTFFPICILIYLWSFEGWQFFASLLFTGGIMLNPFSVEHSGPSGEYSTPQKLKAGFYVTALITFNIVVVFLLQNLFNIQYAAYFGDLSYYLFASLFLNIILITIASIASQELIKFFLPLLTAVLLSILFEKSSPGLLIEIYAGTFLAFIVVIAAYKLSFLTKDGAGAAFVLGSLIFGLGGIKWSAPLLVFFFSASLFSGIRKDLNNIQQRGGRRDSIQVLANGVFVGILVIVNKIDPQENYYWMSVASIAAVCSDTWSTEIGTLKKRATYNIANLRKTEPGISGGVSVVGSIAGIAGAVIVCAASVAWINGKIYLPVFVILAALIGNIIDSLLGAILQGKFKCTQCGRITERNYHCGSRSILINGLAAVNNDVVNFIASISGGLSFYLINQI